MHAQHTKKRLRLAVGIAAVCGIIAWSALKGFGNREPASEPPTIHRKITSVRAVTQVPAPQIFELQRPSEKEPKKTIPQNAIPEIKIIKHDKPAQRQNPKKPPPAKLDLKLGFAEEGRIENESTTCTDEIGQATRKPFSPTKKAPRDELRASTEIDEKAGSVWMDNETGEIHITAKQLPKIDRSTLWEVPHLPPDIQPNPVYKDRKSSYAIAPSLNRCGEEFNKTVRYTVESLDGQTIGFNFILILTTKQVSDSALTNTSNDVKDLFTIMMVHYIANNNLELDERSIRTMVSQLMSRGFKPMVRQMKTALAVQPQ